MRKTPAERLMSHVEMISESGCWIWMARLNNEGYGCFKWNGKEWLAHRASYHHTQETSQRPLRHCEACKSKHPKLSKLKVLDINLAQGKVTFMCPLKSVTSEAAI